ncbi:MAG: peptidoglycan DD-metalloendopeptidase family protein [Nitriliruptor sp.]|uniref:murein hydrolase activator EnvC n=1 Tax=Nitriliruptor sp. TaxID=2448056 RepID=UPI0034A06C6B
MVAAGVLAVGLLVPSVATAQSSGDLQRELDRTRDEAAELGSELGERRGQLVAAEEELAAVGARVIDARGRLRAAEGQLALAEAAETEADAERRRAERAHERTEAELARTQAELEVQEGNLAGQAAAAYKFGSAGARAGSMAFEVVRRAQDPNELAVGMRQIAVVIDAQGDLVAEVAELRDDQRRLTDEAARARARSAQAAADAAAQVRFTAQLREDAGGLAREVAAEEGRQAQLVSQLRTETAETEQALSRVAARESELASELATRRIAAEAAAAAERDRASSSAGSGNGNAGSAGGPAVSGVCPVVGAVAGRDFSNDWGDPRSGSRSHQGNDIFADRGTPIVAIDAAVVTQVNRTDSGLGGLTVSYRTADGSEWYNAHLESVAAGIGPGTAVRRGEEVGTVGTSGNARGTPPHDHIGRRYGGSWVNPWPTISPLCS